MESISVVTRQSAGGSEQLAITVEELNRQTEALRTLVGQFKLNGHGSSETKAPPKAIRTGSLSSVTVATESADETLVDL